MSGRSQAPVGNNSGRICYSCGNSYPAAFRFCPIDSVDLDYLPQSIEDLSSDFGKSKKKPRLTAAVISLFVLMLSAWMVVDRLNSGPVRSSSTYGELTVRTTPAGATVYLDGSQVGVSPVRLSDIPTGFHEVRAVCPGYSDGAAHVEILPSENQKLVWDLAPLPVRKAGDKNRYLADLSAKGFKPAIEIPAGNRI